MSNEKKHSDVLRSAWKRYTELDRTSSKLSKRYFSFRKAIITLGVVATLLAIVTDRYSDDVYPVFAQTLRTLLIIVPIVISVLAAFTNKFMGTGDWLAMRAAAEEILKEIYMYRTVLRNSSNRNQWLNQRMTTIQRRTYKSLGGELIIETYSGDLPPYYDPNNPYSDPGFTDLTGDKYLSYRLVDQRNWHRRKIIHLQRERLRIQLVILGMGGVGAFLAALGGSFVAWVALSASVASALTGWEELRSVDKTIVIYSRLILELTIIRDKWESVDADQRTEADFIEMVRTAEANLWNQNKQYVSTMQEAIASADGDDDAELIEEMISMGDSTVHQLRTKMLTEAKDVMAQTGERLGQVVEESAASVIGMVDTVAEGATAIRVKVEETVEEEVSTVQDLVGKQVDAVAAEAEAIRGTVDYTVDAALEESAAVRESVETTVDTVAAEASAVRDTVQETVVEEAAAAREILETTVDTVATEASAMRETVDYTVDAALKESAAARETLETTVDTVAAEASAVRETVETTVETTVEKSAAMRETVEVTVDSAAAEAEAMRETFQDTAAAALEESAAWREVGETVGDFAEEAASTRKTVQDTLIKAGAVRENVETIAAKGAAALQGTAGEAADLSLDNAIAEAADLMASELFDDMEDDLFGS